MLTFGALADPTRRAIATRLSYGTAGQMADLVQMSWPAVSQHIRVLRDAGVVRGSRDGRFIWYELAGDTLVEAAQWLDDLLEQWANAPTRRSPRDRSRQLRRAGQP